MIARHTGAAPETGPHPLHIDHEAGRHALAPFVAEPAAGCTWLMTGAARRAGARPVAATVALLRERAESRFTPPVTGPRAPLTEVLVHEGDMRIPLGLPLEPDTSGVRIGLEFITTGRPIGFVPRGRLRGLRLVATDDNWEWGDGAAEVHGRGIDLLMAACGRSSVLPALDGQGSKTLAERIPADF